MDDARTRIFASDGTPSASPGVVGGDSRKYDLAPYAGVGQGDSFDFVDASFESHFDLHASLYWCFDSILELCSSGNVVKLVKASQVLEEFELYHTRDSAVAYVSVVLEQLSIVWKISFAFRTAWTLEKVYVLPECKYLRFTLEGLNAK